MTERKCTNTIVDSKHGLTHFESQLWGPEKNSHISLEET